MPERTVAKEYDSVFFRRATRSYQREHRDARPDAGLEVLDLLGTEKGGYETFVAEARRPVLHQSIRN